MISTNSCSLWSSVYECQSGVSVHISGEDRVWYVCDVLYAVLYVGVNCFVVRRCAVSRMYVNICNSDVFSVVNMYLHHLKFCIVCINSRRYVCCSECYVVSNECNEPTHVLCDLSVRTVVKLCTLGILALGVSLVSLIVIISECVLVHNKFELLKFVFNSVYVDQKYNEISLTFTAGFV